MTPDAARALAAAALTAHRTAPANAASVADALVAAELAGQAGHGLRRLASYCAQAACGKVDGFATPATTQPRPGVLAIDAGHGFAYPALDIAVARLPALAAAQGVAAAGVARSHHAGAAGVFVERLAEAGCVALMVANTPAAMAPWGGRRALYGTDPIAFAAPRAGGPPVVVDLSLSTVARGRVMAAAQKGEPIPPGWAMDAEGRPTTDPKAALKGLMAPMGEAKGAALALMVELLCGALVGGAFGFEATSFLDAEGGPPGVAQLLIAFDAGVFGAEAAARVGAMAGAVEGEAGARLPGARRAALRARGEAEGLAVDAALLAEIQRLAKG